MKRIFPAFAGVNIKLVSYFNLSNFTKKDTYAIHGNQNYWNFIKEHPGNMSS